MVRQPACEPSAAQTCIHVLQHAMSAAFAPLYVLGASGRSTAAPATPVTTGSPDGVVRIHGVTADGDGAVDLHVSGLQPSSPSPCLPTRALAGSREERFGFVHIGTSSPRCWLRQGPCRPQGRRIWSQMTIHDSDSSSLSSSSSDASSARSLSSISSSSLWISLGK